MTEFGPTSIGRPTPPGQVFADLRAAVDALNALPPVVTRFEVPPAIDDMLNGLVGVTTTSTTPVSDAAITAVPWSVDPDLPPRTIRTHYSDGTSKVHDL